MMGSWGMPMGLPSGFEEQYHCYSYAYADKPNLEKGDKIVLPQSALHVLLRLEIDYPMLFRLTAPHETTTHTSVLEFSAEEGCVYMPFWMMEALGIGEGSLITVTNVSLPKANFVKFQPQSVDFLDISNPRAVLEHSLRNFSCVSMDDIITIHHNDKLFRLKIREVKPGPAACIIETDCNVDFEPPVGYVEPTPRLPEPEPEPEEEEQPKGIVIKDGKIIRPDTVMEDEIIPVSAPGTTGVQPNAIATAAPPKLDYWAVAAGEGARLDGKAAVLKDAKGNEVDIRQMRAKAAEERLKQETPSTAAAAAPISKRKKIGSKFSKLKTSAAFQGNANKL